MALVRISSTSDWCRIQINGPAVWRHVVKAQCSASGGKMTGDTKKIRLDCRRDERWTLEVEMEPNGSDVQLDICKGELGKVTIQTPNDVAVNDMHHGEFGHRGEYCLPANLRV